MPKTMTRILDIGTIAHLIEGTPVRTLPFFIRKVEHPTRLAMISTAKILEAEMGEKRGRTMMRQIRMELRRAFDQGLVEDCPAVRYDPTDDKLTEEDFKSIMSRFNLQERKLILFSLATRMDIVEAAAIKRVDVRSLAKAYGWSDEIHAMVASIPAHLSTPFLFWRVKDSGLVEPMLSLGSRFYAATKIHWRVFASLAYELERG